MNDLKELLDRRAARLEPTPAAFDRVLRRSRRRQRTRRITSGVLAFVLFAGAATGLWLAFTGPTEPADPTPQPSVVEEPVMSIPLGGSPLDVAVGAGAVWVSIENEVVKLDPDTGSITGRFPLRDASGLTVVGERVCSRDLLENTINCLAADGSSHEQHAVEPLPFEVAPGDDAFLPWDLVATEDAVWVDTARGALARLDLETFERTDLVRLDPAGPSWLAASPGAIWVINDLRGGGLWRVDNRDLSVQSITAPLIDHVAAGPGGVWATTAFGSALRFDEANGTITHEVVLGAAGPLVVTEAHAFVAHRDGTLTQIDLGGPAVSRQVPIGFRGAVSVGATSDALWIAAVDDGAVWRVALCDGSLCDDVTPEPSVTPTTEPAPTRPGAIEIDPGPAEPQVPFVAGDRLIGLPGGPVTLARPADAPLTGWLTPVAMRTNDGKAILYSAWDGTPSIRRHDLQTGEDVALSYGRASSMALRGDGADGAFAYVAVGEGSPIPGPGQIMVTLMRDSEPWTTEPGRYIVAAWAGNTLLAYRQGCCEILDILALDGPGQVRVLGRGGEIVALSPDGTMALLVGSVDGSDFGRLARVVEIATGEVLAELSLREGKGADIFPSYGGSWSGDLVVAQSGNRDLVVMRATRDTLEIERVIHFESIRFGPYEPQWEGDHVVARAVLPGGGRSEAYLDCDLDRNRCLIGPPTDTGLYRVYNPSRPQMPSEVSALSGAPS